MKHLFLNQEVDLSVSWNINIYLYSIYWGIESYSQGRKHYMINIYLHKHSSDSLHLFSGGCFDDPVKVITAAENFFFKTLKEAQELMNWFEKMEKLKAFK